MPRVLRSGRRWLNCRPGSWPMSARWAGHCGQGVPAELDLGTGVRRPLLPEDTVIYPSTVPWRLGRAPWSRGHLQLGFAAADDAFGISPSFREGLASLGTVVLDVPVRLYGGPPESLPGPVRRHQGRASPANPGSSPVSAGPWSSSATSLPGRPGFEITVASGKPGAAHLPFEGATTSLSASPAKSTGLSTAGTGTAVEPRLPVQCSGPPRWSPALQVPLAYQTEKSPSVGLDQVRDPHQLAGITTWPCACWARAFLLILQQAWGEKMPRIQVYRVVLHHAAPEGSRWPSRVACGLRIGSTERIPEGRRPARSCGHHCPAIPT